ncbi:MarR family winged helix-turn-helix transcriptional regulator [Pseudomonas typographi]|uniref:Winged helix DNA-binding protein n=1 Tax=Pseudomonas typographi TaxID=2715964 RepID=A0ABR7YYX7_9PSED|nr:MarR family transcriptional regulator [Pseudomonas typographi]MBD1550097.1 winged helix DNA-binding protein [Pseudomonas typographi]MBD1585479.1 winged helix DNA-binding protein [Pseudomonas typographi]MBD1598408.1 winged helix DNA-binding protein [Pseudomonas typographi]
MNLEKLQQNITSGAVAASRHWRRICQTTLANYGISEACAVPLLMIVRLGDGARQVAVAQAAGMESPSLVRLLDQLCTQGYVQRSEDSTDRRAKALSLTPEGRKLAEAIEGEFARLRKDVFKGVDKADLEATQRVLQAFEDAAIHGPGTWAN